MVEGRGQNPVHDYSNAIEMPWVQEHVEDQERHQKAQQPNVLQSCMTGVIGKVC